MHEYYMKEALKEAKKAFKKSDVPIGCVIIKNNKIVARAFNKKEKRKNAIMHAEINAISKACKKLKTWHLEDCILYCNVEPCIMCIGAIAQSRISKIVYAAENSKFGYSNFILDKERIMNTNIDVISGVCKNESEELLKGFFETIRK